MKTRRTLLAGAFLLSLISLLAWHAGVRPLHVGLLRYFTEPPELSEVETAELHAWVKDHAVHLTSIEAGSGFDDLQPLKKIIGDARIVSLGESQHMVHEYSEVKHRLVEFLVHEMGFTVFAIEAPFSDALKVNDYVLTGKGTAEEALEALRYRAWRTEPILEMIKWMRRYNAAHETKIKFYGFDSRPSDSQAEAIHRYLRQINGTEDYDELLSWFMDHPIRQRTHGRPIEGQTNAVAQINRLIAYLERQRPSDRDVGSESGIQDRRAWRMAVQHARVLLQDVEYFTASSVSESTDLRDEQMAANVRWLMDYEEEPRMILWAANPHVNATPFSGCMGEHLRREYGNDMVVIALMRNRGAAHNSIEAFLSRAELSIGVVDLRFLPEGPVSRYFRARRRTTDGAAILLPWAYDAILFVEPPSRASDVREHPGLSQEPTGRTIPALKPLDDLMVKFVRANRVPGAALAVTRDRRLVYARGFGWADKEAREPVQPDALFRIASVSKPITAVAVLQMIEGGHLRLDDKVFGLLECTPHVEAGAAPDPRLADITVRHLLQHSGGWDREQSFAPMGLRGTTSIATTLGVPPPGRPEDVMRYMAGLPLDFDPGSRRAYSNFGYLILGRVIEHVSGRSYEDYVKTRVLAPLGIKSMRIGRMSRDERAPNEVIYYDYRGRTREALFGPRRGEAVPFPYARSIEIMDAHGGWIASAIDLVRFASAFDDPGRCRILGEQTIDLMFKRPAGTLGLDADGQPAARYYACGWNVRPKGNGTQNAWHGGAIEGTSALLVRRHDGINWAVLFNTYANGAGERLAGLIDPQLHKAVDAVTNWPDDDLLPPEH